MAKVLQQPTGGTGPPQAPPPPTHKEAASVLDIAAKSGKAAEGKPSDQINATVGGVLLTATQVMQQLPAGVPETVETDPGELASHVPPEFPQKAGSRAPVVGSAPDRSRQLAKLKAR